MAPKKYSFYFHYNKPKSKAAGHNILSIHYRGACHTVENIECKVPISTKSRKTQPHCVLVGRGHLTIEGSTAIIT